MPARPVLSKIILSLSLVFLLSGCVTIYNPATQKTETLLINTESEVALGRDMDKEISRKLKIMSDPQRQARLDNISARIAAASDRQDLTYHFKVIDDKEFNAFAAPGGFIYVNKGLMDSATDDELACVLAHEVGHVAARHSVKQMQAGLGYQLIMAIVLGVSGQETIVRATNIIYNLGSLGYSREDELFADKLAVRYAKRAGFNPYGMVTFFKKMQVEAKKKGGVLNIEIFSSHPDMAKRIEYTKKEIASNH
ncbi:MAG: M48 family metallopeptidase [Candidatus Omnitrophota bacterium]|jgi:predicted Zn-dependent protease